MLYSHFYTIFLCESAFLFKESEHTKIIERRAVQDAQTPEGLKSSQAVLEDSQLPLEQKKRRILRNLRNLEQAGLVTVTSKYQDLINDIAKVPNRFFLPVQRYIKSLFCFKALTCLFDRTFATKGATDREERQSLLNSNRR